jgi:hypothetical protein
MHEDTVGGALGRPRSVNWWSVSPANERYGMDHHTRESIEAHLTIVFAALAVSHYIERQTDWSIKKFVKLPRRYRTVKIKAGRQIRGRLSSENESGCFRDRALGRTVLSGVGRRAGTTGFLVCEREFGFQRHLGDDVGLARPIPAPSAARCTLITQRANCPANANRCPNNAN